MTAISIFNYAKPMLSRLEAAAHLGVSAQTLSAWASNKRVSLPYVKIGRRVMYRRIDLDTFCAAHLVGANHAGGQHV